NLDILQVIEVKGGSGPDTIALLNKADGLVIDGGGGSDLVRFAYAPANPNEAASIRIRNIESVKGNSATYDSVTLLDSPTVFEFDGGGRSDNLTLSDSVNNISLTLNESVERVNGGASDDVITLVNEVNGLLIQGGGGTDRV